MSVWFLVHRDLKPSNVLIWVSSNYKGVQPKIGDFGLSKILDKGRDEATMSHTGGSAGWMPPEIAHGKKLVRSLV